MPSAKPSRSNTLLWCVALLSLIFSSISLGRELLQGGNKIVAVDAVKLISEYKGMEEVRRTQQQRNSQLQSNLDTLKQELQASLGEYQKTKTALSKKELALLENVIRARQRNLVTYEQSMNDQIKKQDEEMANALLVKVNDYLKRYGQKNRYTIILASTEFGNVAYAEDDVDITASVLDGLNREYNGMK